MGRFKLDYYLNPKFKSLVELREQAIDYLMGRGVDKFDIVNKIHNTPDNLDLSDVFTSGRIIDNISVIPTTDTERRILSKANFPISDDAVSFLFKDAKTGALRGALSIEKVYDEDEPFDDDDEEFDDAYRDYDEDDEEDDPFIDYDEDDEEPECPVKTISSASPKEYIIRYFDVDPEGKGFEKAMAHVMQSPIGYAIRAHKIKVVKENADYNVLKMFL